ncbi:MAG: serine/threonine protein kinase [Deltaproteobacteria bacterium]|nr:serine/threonine protein kinase [Deltaproteobacteria bacterium]
MLGQVVDGKYEILRLVGEGGMGAVYEARHRTTGRLAALKVISRDDVARNELLIARFEREAQAAAKVRSPHIVEILDAGHDAATGHPYMVMELLVGLNVHRLLRQLGPLPPDLALRIAVQTCFGLEKAHAVGVVHRDIKPANLFLSESDGGERVVKLLDFGVAKFKMDQATEDGAEGLTRTGSVLGSPMFMSPEQARGLKTIDHRADIWSLGVVLYQLLSGKTPHAGIEGVGELIITICSEEPQSLRKRAPWISPKLERVVHGALKLPANARYQSAGEFREALLGCLPPGASGHLTQQMLTGLTDEQRAARPGDEDAAPASEEIATVAIDAGAFAMPVGPSPATGSAEQDATLALDSEGASGASLPFTGRAAGGAFASKSAAGPVEPSILESPGARGRSVPSQVRRDTPVAAGKRAGSAVRLVVGLGLGIVLGVVAIVLLAKRKPPADSGNQAIPMPSSAALAAAPSSSAPPSDPVALAAPTSGATAAPATSPNRVRVVPQTARVLVDGKPVEKDAEGFVVVDGAPNSSHTVAVYWGASPTIKQVVLTEKGPIPSEVVVPLEAGVPHVPSGTATAVTPPGEAAPSPSSKGASTPKKIEF